LQIKLILSSIALFILILSVFMIVNN